jgi:hypothetical protein
LDSKKVLAVQPGAVFFGWICEREGKIPVPWFYFSLYIYFLISAFAASGSLSAKIKKVQGARVKSRTGGGVIKLAEEMGACLGEVREQGSCDLTHEGRSKAKLTCSD